MLSFSFGEEKNPRLKMFSLRYFLILIVLAVFYTAAYSNPIVKDETTTEQSENQLKNGAEAPEKNILDCFTEYCHALTELMAAMCTAMSDMMVQHPEEISTNQID